MNLRRRNRDLDEEIRAHLAMAAQDRVARGETPADAERNARRELGNEALIKEITREIWGWIALERFLQDLRYALRQIRRNPGFAATTILTLAFGLGTTVTMFSIVNGVLLEPLPFRDSARLHVARTLPPPEARLARDFPVNARHFQEWREHCQACESVALVQMDDLTLIGAGEPVKLPAFRVSSNFFATLGIAPALGRDFLPEEEAGLGQVILSDTLWRSRFGGDRAILGRDIQLNGEPRTVIGVLPHGLALPRGDEWGGYFGPADEPLIFEPLGFNPARSRAAGNLNYTAVIRLRPGIAPQRAEAELNALLVEFVRRFKLQTRIALIPLQQQVTRRANTVLWLLFGAVGTVLLIVCVNVGNLMLVRTAGRYREAGVRLALGAGCTRLFGQVLKEALVLVSAGGGLGLLVSYAGLRSFIAAAPIDLPRLDDVRMDWRVLLFAFGATAAATVLCGFAPAWRLSRIEPLDSLKAVSGAHTETGRKLRLREMLAGFEVALSTVLLAAGALLLMSFVRLTHIPKGFETASVITQDVSFLSPKYARGGRDTIIRLMLDRLSWIPGVEAVGACNRLPLRGEDWVSDLRDPASRRDADALANFRFVSGDYWRAMGIPLLEGRFFDDRDWARPVAVVSEHAARHLWPDEDPIGKHVQGVGGRSPALEVVGLVADVPSGPLDRTWPMVVYEPYTQVSPVGMSFAVRSKTDAGAVARAARAVLSSIDPEMALPPARTMEQILDASMSSRRFEMRLIVAFGVAALLLASLGVYGVISFAVARRTPEIGIRLAMGARPAQLMLMVLRQGVGPVFAGLAVGVAGSLAAGRLLASELYEIRPNDPLALSAVVTVLLGAALAACWAPARRATRVDPRQALRCE